MIFIRSTLFFIGAVLVTTAYTLPVITFGLVNPAWGYAVARNWCFVMMAWTRWTVGIRARLVGAHNIPREPCIVAAKHQSAWETMYLVTILPRQSFVVKKELLYLPLVGQCFQALRMIIIDRKAGTAARDQIVQQGTRCLEQGLWVNIFPEGTRTAPGQRKPYKIGAAMLAVESGRKILPIALNSGEFWRRYAFMKYPGTVTVSIGPPLDPAGKSAQALNAELENWIEGEMPKLNTYGTR